MARYKKGVNGPFTGKVGHVVGVKWRGIDYMRSLAEPSSVGPSKKQLRHRQTFAMISSWLKPLRALIKIGFQQASIGKTAMNEAFQLLYRTALKEVGGEILIDYPKVIFSRGDLLISLVRELLSVPDAAIHVKWENALGSVFNKDEDQATFVVYNPNKQKFVTFQNAADRANREVSLQLPGAFIGDVVHCWMQYANAEGDQVSTTVYLGAILVG